MDNIKELTTSITRLFAIKNPKGFTADDIGKVKKLYGGLPNTLEVFYLQLGRSDELINIQDELILPGKYPVFLDYDHLIFFNENQGVSQAGIALADIKEDDPPVYVGYENKEWIKAADTLSGFLIAMFGYQASLSLQYAPKEFYWINKTDLEIIKEHFAGQPESLPNWLYHEVDLYAGSPDERISIMNSGDYMSMIYAANNEQAFTKMQNILTNIGEAM